VVADAVQSAITEPHRKNMIPAGQPRAEVSVATPQRMAIIMELGNKRQRVFGMGDTFLDSLDASHVHPIDPRKVDHPKPDQERLEAEKRDVGGDAARMIEAGQVGWRLDADSHPYITRPEEPLAQARQRKPPRSWASRKMAWLSIPCTVTWWRVSGESRRGPRG